MTEPYYADDAVTLYAGDCLAVLPTLPDNSVDAVCTDPPYGLEFMGKEWDKFKTGRGEQYSRGGDLNLSDIAAQSGKGGAGPVYINRPAKRCANCGKQAWSGSPCKCPEPQWIMDNSPLHSFQQWCQLWAAECLRVLKPGGHLLAFGGTRTWHRLAVAIEDAGFEIRDSIAWLYGSGFPKSLDVSKAIDRKRDDHQDIVRVTSWLKAQATARGFTRGEIDQHMGTSDMAGWWLTDLPHRCQCPTWEQWETLRRFMGLPDDMDAEVWRLNGRKGTPGEAWDQREVVGESAFTSRRPRPGAGATIHMPAAGMDTAPATADAQRWQGWGTALKPAHEPIVVARKPLAGTVAATVLAYGTGALNIDGCRIGSGGAKRWETPRGGIWTTDSEAKSELVDSDKGRWPANVALDETAAAALDQQSGEASYNPGKTFGRSSGGDIYGNGNGIPAGADVFGYGDTGGASRFMYTAKADSGERITHDGVAHPTVKPLSLMRWLVRLVTPPGGLILEPFAGSGTTVEAAILEGFRCIAIEREADYLPLITQRINRRRDPIAYLTAAGEDLGLFDDEEPA